MGPGIANWSWAPQSPCRGLTRSKRSCMLFQKRACEQPSESTSPWHSKLNCCAYRQEGIGPQEEHLDVPRTSRGPLRPVFGAFRYIRMADVSPVSHRSLPLRPLPLGNPSTERKHNLALLTPDSNISRISTVGISFVTIFALKLIFSQRRPRSPVASYQSTCFKSSIPPLS